MDKEAKIQDAVEYIDKNLCKKIILNDLAKKFYFSKYHFHRLFHNITGETIMQYVRKRRLTEAAIDLNQTKESITNIALKYQFSSEESFSRAFKRLYGISPREYRNSKNRIAYFSRINVIKASHIADMNNRTVMCRAA